MPPPPRPRAPNGALILPGDPRWPAAAAARRRPTAAAVWVRCSFCAQERPVRPTSGPAGRPETLAAERCPNCRHRGTLAAIPAPPGGRKP